MSNRRVHIGIYILEALLLLGCVVGMVFFFLNRACALDILFLLLWGAVLLALVPPLICGELRLRRKEERSDLVGKDEFEENAKWKN